MADLIIKISGDTDEYTKAIKKVGKETKSLQDTLSGIAKTSAVAFAGFAIGIGLAVKEAAKFEQIQVQFEVLTGSVEAATKSVAELSAFAARTPFQFENIAKAGQQLLAFGFSTDQLIPLLGSLGDVSAATGSDLNEVGLIFGQVAAAGKLTGERFLQFQERAIPIGPAIAKTMGVAENAVRGLVSEGKVSFDIFEKAFKSLSEEGGLAFNGMAKQSETLNGLISTLTDNFSLTAAEVGKEFVPAFKKAVEVLIDVFRFIREHPKLIKTAAGFLAIGAAITGMIAVLATGGVLFLKLRTAMLAAGGAVKVLTLGFRALAGATGIGLILVAITLLIANWDIVLPAMQAVFITFSKNIIAASQGLANILLGALTLNPLKFKEGLDQITDLFAQGLEEFKLLTEKNKPDIQTSATPEEIAIKAEAARAAKAEQEAIDAEQRALFREENLIAEEEFAEVLAEFKGTTREEELSKLDESQKQELAKIQQGILNKKTAQEKAAKDELKRRIDANNKFLVEQQRFGTAFATINEAINSSQVQGLKSATGELSALQQSSSKELKSIGKAAAVAQIVINTARAALNIFAGFSTIPFVGPALGIAGAAVAIAFGAEQIGKVTSAQAGGLITGGISGVDSVPALLAPGELVVPQSNFDEVVGAVAEARGNRTTPEGGGEISDLERSQEVIISFEGDEASQVLTARQNEDRSLGISRESAA